MSSTPVHTILSLTARDLSKAIHVRRVSSREVMTTYLDRIDALNPREI